MPTDKLTEAAEMDVDLVWRVKDSVLQRGYTSHRMLEISVERGVVVVQGRMPTFYLRLVAVECIRRVAGVIQVVDLIEVANDLRQRHLAGTPKDETESSAASTRHSADVPGMPREAHDAPQSDFHIRRRLTVKG